MRSTTLLQSDSGEIHPPKSKNYMDVQGIEPWTSHKLKDAKRESYH